jgi:hypothetical protein
MNDEKGTNYYTIREQTSVVEGDDNNEQLTSEQALEKCNQKRRAICRDLAAVFALV